MPAPIWVAGHRVNMPLGAFDASAPILIDYLDEDEIENIIGGKPPKSVERFATASGDSCVLLPFVGSRSHVWQQWMETSGADVPEECIWTKS